MRERDGGPPALSFERAATPPAGAADQAARVQVELAAQVASLTRLSDLGGSLSAMADIQAVLDQVLRTVLSLLDSERGVLMLYEEERRELFTQVSIGFGAEYLDAVGRVAEGEGACGQAVAQRAPVVVEDVHRDPLFAGYVDAAELGGYRAVYSTPMITVGGELMGTIAAYFPAPHRPEERVAQLVATYAGQAAEMVVRARLHGEARQLAALERRRGEQLRGLAQLALELTPALDVDRILRLVAERARELVGTHQSVATRLVDGWATSSTHVSLSDKYAQYRTYDEVPKGLGVLNYVTRENKPLRLTGAQLVAHPEWRGLRDSVGHPPLPDYLAAPFIGRDGTNLGLVQLSDKVDGTPFTAEDESILVQIAQMGSAALENTELIEAERSARARAEEQSRLGRKLVDASQALSTSLQVEDVLDAVVHLPVPDLADWCAVHLVEDGHIALAASRAVDASLADRLLDLARRRPPRLDDPFGTGAAIRTGRSQLFSSIPDDVLAALATDEVPLEELSALEVRTGLVVPLTARGATIGALSLARFSGAAYDEQELGFAEELAARAALAVDNARRYQTEREIGARLQRSLLPRALPTAAGIMAASRYLPGAAGTEIGGDWYDVIELSPGCVGLAVGDVMGRGIAAAAVMGQLRAALRAYALEAHQPAELLTRLDRLVEALGEVQLVTCTYGQYDATTGDLTVASAGHLPPLLLEPDVPPRFLELDPGLPLGVGIGEGAYRQTTVHLAPGATVLLYTDGLVEDSSCGIEEGMERLRAAAVEPVHSPDELCDRVLQAMGRDGDHGDDTALLAVTMAGAATDDEAPAELELAPDPMSAAVARRFTTDLLEQRRMSAVADTAVLLVSEVTTNAVQHARTTLKLRVAVHGRTLHVDVADDSLEAPVRRPLDVEAEAGRGLLLVESLADRWGHEPTSTGKRVWFELDTPAT